MRKIMIGCLALMLCVPQFASAATVSPVDPREVFVDNMAGTGNDRITYNGIGTIEVTSDNGTVTTLTSTDLSKNTKPFSLEAGTKGNTKGGKVTVRKVENGEYSDPITVNFDAEPVTESVLEENISSNNQLTYDPAVNTTGDKVTVIGVQSGDIIRLYGEKTTELINVSNRNTNPLNGGVSNVFTPPVVSGMVETKLIDSNIPHSRMSQFSMVSAGRFHNIALKPDGTVWGWGKNDLGQVDGIRGTVIATPKQITELSNIVSISAGSNHNLAVDKNGEVWAWGEGNNGVLGNNVSASGVSYVPFKINSSSLTNVIAVSAGLAHSLALKSDGTVVAWGINSYGQLGDNTSTSTKLTPYAIPSTVINNVKAIGAGYRHSVFLKNDGTVWSIGSHVVGELGDKNLATGNTTTSKSAIPLQATGLTGIQAISTNGISKNTLALKSDGTVYIWGDNSYGQLGVNKSSTELAHSAEPLLVTGLNNIISIDASDRSNLVIRNDGKMFAWGMNGNSRLGDGTTIQRNSPVEVTVANTKGVVDFSAGDEHVVISKSDGTIAGWGLNSSSQSIKTDDTFAPSAKWTLAKTIDVTKKYILIYDVKADAKFMSAFSFDDASNFSIGDASTNAFFSEIPSSTTWKTSYLKINGADLIAPYKQLSFSAHPIDGNFNAKIDLRYVRLYEISNDVFEKIGVQYPFTGTDAMKEIAKIFPVNGFIAEATVPNGASTIQFTIPELGRNANLFYVTQQKIGYHESNPTFFSMKKEEQSSPIVKAQVQSINNVGEGTTDRIQIAGLASGTSVRLYKKGTNGYEQINNMIANSKGVAIMSFSPSTAGITVMDQFAGKQLYLTKTDANKNESDYTAIVIPKVQTSAVIPQKNIVIYNNPSATKDKVIIYGLKTTETVKIYNSKKQLLTADSIDNSGTSRTITLSADLGKKAGNIFVTKTELDPSTQNGKLESGLVSKSFRASK